jgi:recombinational DNA repair ATPase RecF
MGDNTPLWVQDAHDDEDVVWMSFLDKEMVSHLNAEQLQELVDELDKTVYQVCSEFENQTEEYYVGYEHLGERSLNADLTDTEHNAIASDLHRGDY